MTTVILKLTDLTQPRSLLYSNLCLPGRTGTVVSTEYVIQKLMGDGDVDMKTMLMRIRGTVVFHEFE